MPSLSDLYNRLGVAENASQEEIKKAFNIKALLCHPDKVSGKEEEFRQLREAYEILSNPEKRNNFIKPFFSGYDAFLSRYKKEKLFFQLITTPDRLNHYAYYNKLFNLTANECLVPGEAIQDIDRRWEKLSYVGHMIMLNLKTLNRQHPKPSKEIKERIKIIRSNEKKLGVIINVLLNPERKLLYDISLEINHNDEMQEIERLVGGRNSIKLLIRIDPKLGSEWGISALKKAGLLTPNNFKHLLAKEDKNFHIAATLASLPEDLVTQANFDKLLQHKKNIHTICRAIAPLKLENILNQKFFDLILNAGKDGETVGNNLSWLPGLGLLNNEVIEMVNGKLRSTKISKQLSVIYQEGALTPTNSAILLWSGSPELSLLNSRIHQMLAYGVFLLSCDVDKGEKSIFLAIELKSMLKNFYEMPSFERAPLKEQFSKDFLKKLHSLDSVMATHRQGWKIITANVFIAATVIGIVFIAINRGMLFSKTHRQKQVEKVDKEFGDIPAPS